MAQYLPTAETVLRNAFNHFAGARTAASEAQQWVTAVDSPMTDQQRAAAEVLRVYAARVKALIDEGKGAYFDALDGR